MLDLAQPHIMGILNVTPDSFSDGGLYVDPPQALAQAVRMVAEGATLIDVGGESTRPGAQSVSVDEELARVIPVVKTLRAANFAATVSIDTSKPEVMRAAVAAGAGIINDVYALQAPGALEAAASLQVPVCLMHMQGAPRTMQVSPRYDNVVEEVKRFLLARVEACVSAGIPEDRLILDPGFGFGKSVAHNLVLFKHLRELAGLGFPLLIGVSRKSMLGAILNTPVEARLPATISLTALALDAGVRIIRVHDVAPNFQAMQIVNALSDAG